MQILLEENGYIVSSCRRGDLAIDSIKENRPDIVLLDIALPFFSGAEVCKIIRLSFDLPIIAITENKSPKNAIELFSLGADDFICKPFNSRELILRIDSVIKRCMRA